MDTETMTPRQAFQELLDLARNVAAMDSSYTDYSGVLPDAVREWQKQAREILANYQK